MLNKHIIYINDILLSILILNAIYAPALEVNLLSSNALGVEHGLRVNLDIPSKPSQILKGEIVIRNLIQYNNLYLINLINMNSVVLLLWATTASKKLISL